MTTEPTPPHSPQPTLHPALAVPLLPFVLVYEGLRWLGRTVRDGLGPVSRVVVWILTPVRVLADLVARVFARAGQALAGVLSALGHALAPAGRALAAPFVRFGRKLSAALWKLDHAVSWVWQQTARARALMARVATAVMAPVQPIGRAVSRLSASVSRRARSVSASVRTLGPRVRNTFRRRAP